MCGITSLDTFQHLHLFKTENMRELLVAKSDLLNKDFYVFKAFGELVKDVIITIVALPILILVFWRIPELVCRIPK